MPHWVRDTILEARLEDAGLEYEWRDRISLTDIDVKGSLKNNARLGEQIDDEHTLKIACSMEAGHPLPGVVLRKKVGKRLVYVMAGNHRISAAELNRNKTVGGYILKCSDEEADRFTRSDNRRHGKAQEDPETYEHVYALHKQYEVPIAELAREFSIPKDRLQNIVLGMRLREELEAANISTDKLSTTAIVALNPIHQNKDVFLKAAQLAASSGMSSGDVQEMTKQVKGRRSQQQQNTVLAEWQHEIEKKGKAPKPKRSTPAKTKLFKLLSSRTGLLTLLRSGKSGKPITKINDLCLEPPEAQKLLDDWKAIEERMKPLLAECKQWVKQHTDANGSGPKRKKSTKRR
jgi:hypothetical protein